MNTSVDFEREFYRDIRDKKRTASGIHKQKGKRGYVGKLMTTVDYLTGKEKREYIKPGKVVKWNMYKELIPLDELKKEYDQDQQRDIVNKWRERFSDIEIMKNLKLNLKKYYSYLREINVPIDRNPHHATYNMDLDKLITYEEFKKLGLQDKYYHMINLTDHFKAQELADVWGVSRQTIHSAKNNYKLSMEKRGFPLEKPEDFELAPIYVEPQEEHESAVKIDKASEGPKIVSMRDSAKDEPIPENIKSVSGAVPMPVYSSEKTQSVESNESHGMTMNYVDEKEGFLLHQDLKRFITMLEKNPDNFRVEMKIKRVGDHE